MIEVKVPDIGDFKDVEIIEVLVKPGDRVEKEASLITLESDKATIEIPSPHAGVVKELRVKLGDKVSQGSPILLIEESAGAATVAPSKPAPAPAAVAAPVPTLAPAKPAAQARTSPSRGFGLAPHGRNLIVAERLSWVESGTELGLGNGTPSRCVAAKSCLMEEE